MGRIKINSPLILAPMSSISTPPFRLLMEELGAGATVSELISAHGIVNGNRRTLEMLYIDRREKVVGLQLFGHDQEVMAMATDKAVIILWPRGEDRPILSISIWVAQFARWWPKGPVRPCSAILKIGPFFGTYKKEHPPALNH